VFLGGRTVADLHCLDRFAELAADTDRLRVVGVCEDDPLDPEVAPGTLPEAVVRTGDWSGHDVLLSGSPSMIRATVSALLVDGTSLDQIRYDPFTD
jgi:NAD(P)H-flavin reductase